VYAVAGVGGHVCLVILSIKDIIQLTMDGEKREKRILRKNENENERQS
jgi:hypothetical protein